MDWRVHLVGMLIKSVLIVIFIPFFFTPDSIQGAEGGPPLGDFERFNDVLKNIERFNNLLKNTEEQAGWRAE